MPARQAVHPPRAVHPGGPFDPCDEGAYRRWRSRKLREYPTRIEDVTVDLADPGSPGATGLARLAESCRKANMAIYRCERPPPDARGALRALCARLGLDRPAPNPCAAPDGITAISVGGGADAHEYIPYTERALNWHTDGYYNARADRVGAFAMHCVRPAAEGGANAFIDPEILYMSLRDEDPRYAAALARPDAMTVPPNVQGGRVVRPERTGPVFSVDPTSGALHMRYTARTRSIAWADDPAVREAADCLRALLAGAAGDAFRVRLDAGQGVVCNNVLHMREAFRDAPERRRLVLRARFVDRVGAASG